MSSRGGAWRKGGTNALYLGNGLAGQTLTTQGTSEAPVVALYNATGALLATKVGRVRDGVVLVKWDGEALTAIPVKERDVRAPHARYRVTIPEVER